MGLEHTLAPEKLADVCRAQLEAFDQLPKNVREFMRNSEIPLDAVKTLEFVRMYGAQAFIGAAKPFIREFQKQNPIIVGSAV